MASRYSVGNALGTPTTPRTRRQSFFPTTPSRPAPFIASQLPTLSLKPLPPHFHQHKDEHDFERRRAADVAAIDDSVQLVRDTTDERMHQVAAALAEIEDEKKRLEDECRALVDKAKTMRDTREEEKKQLDEAKEADNELTAKETHNKVQGEAVRTDIQEYTARLIKLREFKAKRRAAFGRQASKNAPELKFFEDKLGLKIRGKGRDIVSFTFTNVDAKYYPTPFTFDLDASKREYSIPSVKPSLGPDVVDRLLKQLNSSRDLYGFVAEMRKAFKATTVA